MREVKERPKITKYQLKKKKEYHPLFQRQSSSLKKQIEKNVR